MAAQAVTDGVDVLAVMGGDGMMHLGVNTVATAHRSEDHRTTLGLIPAGTGNDLCRGIGLNPDDPTAAATVIAAGHTRAVDVMRIGARYVGGVLATGFDALVNRRANEMAWPRGLDPGTPWPPWPSCGCSRRCATGWCSTVRYASRRRCWWRSATPARTAAGCGSARTADPFDGELDVTIIHPVGRLKLLRLLPEMFSGKFARDACVEQLRVNEVTVEGMGLVGFGDGELIAAAPLTARVVPGAIPVLVPGP